MSRDRFYLRRTESMPSYDMFRYNIYLYIRVYAEFFINNFRLYTHLDSVHHQLYDLLVSFCNNFFSNSRRTCIFFFFFFKRNSFLDFYSLRAQSLRFFFFWLVSKIYASSYLVSFNRCQNKMCRNEAFSFFFFFFIFTMTRGTRVYLTRIQKRLKNNSSICSFLFFFFLRLIIEHNFGVLIRAYKFAPSTLAPCTCMYVCVCMFMCIYVCVYAGGRNDVPFSLKSVRSKNH